MKTKTIFKMLALAMMMPAMMLTTACSSDDNAVENENNKKGYAIPVTVNVTREGDGTRTTYNETTNKLEFSSGDQLFVHGQHVTDNTPNRFGGYLTWVSEGTFTGTIVTQLPYTGTANDLFSSAYTVAATLLPNGYESYGFLSVKDPDNHHYGATLNNPLGWANAIATSTDLETAKALAVEQFSFECAVGYSSGSFVLSPGNAILNFTITGLTANADVTVNITVEESPMITDKVVTTDGSGNATFAIGVEGGWNLNDIALTVDGNAITLVNSSKPLVEGHVYNITRSALQPCSYTAPSLNTTAVTYNGSAVAEYVTAGSATNATMYYKVDYTPNVGDPTSSEWSTTVPSAPTEAGTYTVYYKVVPADGYSGGVESTSLGTKTIAQATPSGSVSVARAPQGIGKYVYQGTYTGSGTVTNWERSTDNSSWTAMNYTSNTSGWWSNTTYFRVTVGGNNYIETQFTGHY